jgi:hypothetical protein
MDKNNITDIIAQTESIIGSSQIREVEKIDDFCDSFAEFKNGAQVLLKENELLQLGVVGQVKAGKSSFLNSLFFNGENVLPKASTPMTAGLTIMEYSDKNSFDVEYFSSDDWNSFVRQDNEYRQIEQECKTQFPNGPESVVKKEIESRTSEIVRSAHEMVTACGANAKQKIGAATESHPFSSIADLQNILEQYVGANGEYTSVVKSLYIKMSDDRLQGLRIVDTPGVNDPVVSRENRTRSFLHTCHGVFLLSSSSDFLGSGDVSFLNNRIGSQGIACVLLLASKFDSVLQDIGAEYAMKQQGKADLVDEVNKQKRKFERRLNELKSTIVEGLNIKLDYTSGIGFSIAHKPEKNWDDMERTVVSQMKRFYPDYFSTEKDVIETFDGLSNINDIRAKYIEDWFKKNKDSIIQQKTSAYLVKNAATLKDVLNKHLIALNEKKDLLQKTSVEEIEQEKKNQEKLFKDLNNTFKEKLESFNLHLQGSYIRDLSNSMRANLNEIDIPTEESGGSVCYKGALWGHNTDYMKYSVIDTHRLHDNIQTKVRNYLNDVNKKWGDIVDEVKKNILNELSDKIAEKEKELMSVSFNAAFYRSRMLNVFDEIRLNQVLDIRSIEEKIMGSPSLMNIINSNYVPSDKTKDLHQYDLADFFKDGLANKIRIEVYPSLSNLSNGMEGAVKEVIDTQLNDITKKIDKMKEDFGSKLTGECKVYLDKLEIELKKKESSIIKVQSAITAITELETLYSK